MATVGAANVIVRPIVADFRTEVATAVNRSIGSAAIPLPVSPTIAKGSTLTWETLASGAAIPKVVPLPVQPTITPEAKAAFAGEVGGLRGALLGGGQFAASRALGISGLAAGLFVFGKAAVGAVKSAATLEQELNVFQQVSGASAEQMARVRAEARALGADLSLPAVSAGDAAATMTELAKAGLSVDDVLNGTKGTLQLAAAAQLDFATATDLAASALNAFQLPGSEAVKIADLLAGAANAAQGDIADFGGALTQAAAVAHQAGLSVEQTVTFLTELAKAGIQGSDAGTSLRVALLRLIAPTNEANAIFKELGIQITDAAGNVRVDVFEQLRQSMLALDPATRNAALATIFGTDAIRSAAIFVRDGAKGFEEMERQVSRSGQAADTAAARTKGLSGGVSALASNLETLGADLGTLVIPLVSAFVQELNDLTAALDKTLLVTENAIGRIGDEAATLGEKLGSSGFGQFIADASKSTIDFGNRARRATDDVLGLRGAIKATGEVAPLAFPNLKGFEGAGDRSSPQFDRAADQAAKAGANVGKAFVRGTADAITKEERSVINAAKRTVQTAQAALRDVVAEGAKAVEAAAVDAKQNLTSIGQGLATQVNDLLATGPLAQRIENLQDRLDKSRAGIQRGSLRRELRDAQEELARAEAQLAGGAPKTAAQRAGEEQFLRPFQEKVKDAQAALEEFNTQGTIDKLTARLESQKARLQKTLDDLIAKFNAGLLSGTAVNAQVAGLLQKNVGPMAKAGTAQGFAFRQAFQAQLAALQAQIAAITGGPQTKKTGAEPGIVSPADTAAQVAARTAAAQRSVKDAIVNLQKANTAAVTGPEGTNALLKDIRRELKGRPSRPSGDVAGPKPKPKAGSRK